MPEKQSTSTTYPLLVLKINQIHGIFFKFVIMKRLFRIITVFVIMTTACTSGRYRHQSFWPGINPDADMLTLRFEHLMFGGGDDTTAGQIVDSLELLDREGVRTRIFRARLMRRRGDMDSSAILLNQALSVVDSVNDSYTYNRILFDMEWHVENEFDRYLILAKAESYFRTIGDSIMLASALIDMSSLLYRLRYFQRSMSLLDEGQQILEHKYPQLHSKININRALILRELGRVEDADSIDMAILDDGTIAADINVRELVLRNLYRATGNPEYIFEDYRMIHNRGSARNILPLIQAMVSEVYVKMSEPDSAMKYARFGKDGLNDNTGINKQIYVLGAYAEALRLNNRFDSACYYYRIVASLNDSIENLNIASEVARMDANRRIATLEHRQFLVRQAERLNWAITLAIVLFLLMSVSFFFYRHSQRAKIRQLRSEMEMERNRRHVAATLASIEEKDKVIAAILHNIRSGTPNSELRELETMLIAHAAGADERESFAEMFEKVSPAFVSNLRRLHPDLPDYYLRLASYIRAGMSNHQIARILGVRLESVHQSRTRLRARLDIPRDLVLEDALRRIEESS